MQEALEKDIKSLENLLFNNDIQIPDYQRPYKWQTKNVNQLLDDILAHTDRSAYRLGTVVLHKEAETLNIVDGQQRMYTLSLLAYELLNSPKAKNLVNLDSQKLALANSDIENITSFNNLKRNHLLIKSRINEFDRDSILFFFQKCEFVYIELKDISEAFQFFDSQNTRGKDLAPHDLLKAFHLREMEGNSEMERLECVKKWEEVSDSLHHIFENYLYKIRSWSKGRSGMNFNKDKVGTFKGINLNNTDQFNFIQPYRINHFITENYNRNPDRNIDGNKMNYPFQLDMVMLNGKRFFEYVHYYANYIQMIENTYSFKKEESDSIIQYLEDKESSAKNILKELKFYNGRDRRGDLFVRNLFDCCLLYYLDKFGPHQFDKAIIKFFVWSYTLRLELQSVKEVSVDNHAMTGNGFFRVLRESLHSNEITHRYIQPAKYVGDTYAVKNIEGIVEKFKQFNSLV
jgi:hypothetical protein